MHPLPSTEPEIAAFLEAFETGTLPKQHWTHGAHLLTGACYVHTHGEAAAADRMRLHVQRYNLAVGGQNTDTSGYHETITLFWIKLLARLLQVHSPARSPISRATFAALAVERFSLDRTILHRFYSFDVVASTPARRAWTPPDLRTLEDELPL